MPAETQMQEIPVKVYRSNERIAVAAPMPGLEPENIGVEVTEGRLTLHGDLRGMLKGENEVIADEWNPGPYHREVELPSAVDGEMANVTYNNGVVVVALPIAQRTRPAQIRLDPVSATHGERVGNFGHPIQDAKERRRA